jgi:predicted CXXCH cytochrome family protein
MSWWICLFLALAGNKSAYAANPHYDSTHGVHRIATVPPTIGQCTQCHRSHLEHGGAPSPKNLFAANDNDLCYAAGGPGGCHTALPAGYPVTEIDRMPEGSVSPGYIEVNNGGQRLPGVSLRRGWTGRQVFEDPRPFGLGRFYSPHRNDPDMPRQDEEGRGLCLNCHDPHGGRSQFDLTRKVYQSYGGPWTRSAAVRLALCLDCHGPSGPPGMETENRFIADYYNPGINPDGTAGHAIRRDPDVAISWPAHVQVGDPLRCDDCHNPHGSRGQDGVNANGFAISDQRPGWYGLTDPLNDPLQNRRFCLGCHVPSDGVAGSQQVEGIVMNSIPDEEGHASTDTPGCSACHGSDYATATSFNVHHPNRDP